MSKRNTGKLSNIKLSFSKDPEISEEERIKYGTAFSYFDQTSQTLQDLYKNSRTIDELSSEVGDQIKSLKAKVKTNEKQYILLSQAINQLKLTADNVDDINNEINDAWEKLVEVENKLLERPEYSGYKQIKEQSTT